MLRFLRFLRFLDIFKMMMKMMKMMKMMMKIMMKMMKMMMKMVMKMMKMMKMVKIFSSSFSYFFHLFFWYVREYKVSVHDYFLDFFLKKSKKALPDTQTALTVMNAFLYHIYKPPFAICLKKWHRSFLLLI